MNSSGVLPRASEPSSPSLLATVFFSSATRIAALKIKSVDAAIVNLAVALNLVQRGEGRILLRFNDLLKDFHAHVIFASDKAIATKPEALRGFLKGWFETVAFMHGNKVETVRIAKDVMGTDEATAGLIYDELMPMFSSTGKFEPQALAVLSRSFVEMKTLPSEPDMSKLCPRTDDRNRQRKTTIRWRKFGSPLRVAPMTSSSR